MFESFSVGASFSIIDRATPTLELMIRNVRALKTEATEAGVALKEMTRGVNVGGLTRRLTAMQDQMTRTAAAAADLRASFTADFDSIGAGLMIAAGNARELAAAMGEVAVAQRALSRSAGLGGGGGSGGGGRGGAPLHGFVPLGPAGLRLGGPAAIGALATGFAAVKGTEYAAEEQQSIMFAIMGANINPASDRGKALAAQLKVASESAAKGTVFSYQEVASILPALVNIGLQPENGQGSSIEKIMTLIRPVSTFAESESLFSRSIGKDWDLQGSAVAAMQFAHLAGAYDPQQLRSFLDVLAPVSMATERSPAEMVTTGKYALPIAGLMGFKPADTAEMVGLLTALGATGSTAGTGLRQGLYGLLKEGPGASLANQLAQSLGVRAVGGSASGSARAAAERNLGFTDAHGRPTFMDDSGAPSFGKIVDILQAFSKGHSGVDLVNELSKIMSVRGAQVFAQLAAGNAPQLWAAMQGKVGAFPGSDSFQQIAAANSPVQQWKQFIANSENLLNTIATSSGAVAGLTDVLKTTNAFLLRMIEFFGGNPTSTDTRSGFRKWLETPIPGTGFMGRGMPFAPMHSEAGVGYKVAGVPGALVAGAGAAALALKPTGPPWDPYNSIAIAEKERQRKAAEASNNAAPATGSSLNIGRSASPIVLPPDFMRMKNLATSPWLAAAPPLGGGVDFSRGGLLNTNNAAPATAVPPVNLPPPNMPASPSLVDPTWGGLLHKESFVTGGGAPTINLVFPGVTGDPKQIKAMVVEALRQVLTQGQLGNQGEGAGTRSPYEMGVPI